MSETPHLTVLPGPSGKEDGGIASGFFSRAGGHSEGDYAGLNCGFGSSDRHEDVTRNRKAVADWLGVDVDYLINPHQVHSADVEVVRQPWRQGEGPKVDALVTCEAGLAIAILTADCAPVLFADQEAGVIGAAHAGWRGALDGVIGACVAVDGRAGGRTRADRRHGRSLHLATGLRGWTGVRS